MPNVFALLNGDGKSRWGTIDRGTPWSQLFLDRQRRMLESDAMAAFVKDLAERKTGYFLRSSGERAETKRLTNTFTSYRLLCS
jgi:hypothetical protein